MSRDLVFVLAIDTQKAAEDLRRLADMIRQQMQGAGASSAASADQITRSLRDAAAAAATAQRALDGAMTEAARGRDAAKAADALADALRRSGGAASATGRAMDDIGPGGTDAARRGAEELSDALRRADVDAKQVDGAMGGLAGSAKDLAAGLAAGIAGALAGGALVQWTSDTINAADELDRLSQSTGVSVEKLSQWGAVAQRNGLDVSDLAEQINELQAGLSEVDKDTEGAGYALKQLGIDYNELKKLTSEEAFARVAEGLAQVEDSGQKAAMAMMIGGDEYQKYIAVLNDIGAGGLAAAAISTKQARAASDLKDQIAVLTTAGSDWSQSVVGGIIPALRDATLGIADVITGVGGMTKEARRLSRDGTITAWANNTVYALSYVSDLFQLTGRAAFLMLSTIDTAVKQIALPVIGLLDAAGKAMAGNFAGAGAALSNGFGAAAERGQQWVGDMSRALDGTLGGAIRARIDETERLAKAGNGAYDGYTTGQGQPNPKTKPEFDPAKAKEAANKKEPKAGQGADAAALLAKAQAQAALMAETDATNAIRKELERRHSMGLAASGDYYQQLAALAERESKAKLAAIDAEAAAEKARATKDPASAKQSEARLVDIAAKRAHEIAEAKQRAADIGAQAERQALDESRDIAQQWAQSWQAADKQTQQYASAAALAQAAMIVDPLERARAEARIAAQQIADDGAQMMLDLGNQIDTLSGAGLSAQADALRAKLDQIREGIKAEQERTIAAPDVAMVADYLGEESPGQKIAEGFDAASQSLSAFVTGFQSLFKVEADYGKAISARGLTSQQIADIEAKHSAQQVNAYGTLAGAAKGMFKQHTAGFKIMAGAEKAFRAYELAMAIKSAAVKMGLFGTTAAAKVASVATETGAVIAGQGVETGAVVAGEAARNAAKVPGVFMSYMSMLGPFGMAAAGVAIAAVLGGAFGSKGGAAPTSADRQASQGTGTVLGDDSAKSQSVTKSLDRLRDVNTLTMQYSAQMLASLRGIEAAMAGVSTQILRAGGVTTGKNLGIQTGSSGAGDAIGSLLSKIPLIGGVMGGIVGNVISGIFGKSSSSITDAGLSISGTAAQMQQGQGVNQYADKTTTKKSWFGSSTKTSTILQDAGADVSRQFGLIFGGVSDSLQSAAGAMGQDAAAVAQRLAGYVIDIPRLSLQGLKGDDLQEAISTAVGAKADEMARLVAPGLVDFQRIGEGYFETVTRVASATESAGETLRRLGVASVGLGQVVNKGAEDIGAEIVRQSITALEGVSVGIGSVIDLMAGSAQELADTYSALRDVRDSLVMMGVSGAAVSRAMLTGAGGLEQLASGVTAFEEGFFSESERTQMATARMAAEFKRLGVAMPATREGFRALVTGIDTSTEAGQRLVGSLLPLSAQFADLVDAAAEASTAVEMLTEKQRQQVQATLSQLGIGRGANADTAVSAAGGMDAFQSGIAAFEAQFYSGSERFAIQSARLADQFRVLGVEMPATSGGFRAMVSGVDATSEAGSRLLGGLLPLSGGFADLMDRMGQLKTATSSLGKGVEDEVARIRGVIGQSEGQSVAGAQAAFTVATAAARAGDTKALESLPGLSQALLKSAEEQATTRADLARLQAQTAASLQTTLDTVRDAPVSVIAAPVAGVPGVIAPAAQTGATAAAPAAPAAQASGGNSALLIELQALRTESAAMRAELQAMRAESASGLTTIATNTGRSARILDRVTAGGDTIQTEAVA